jgi:1-deoxy-D-xylulose-5-phosphate synthase
VEPSEDFSEVPLYEPQLLREGTACAIVVAGEMCAACEEACRLLEAAGIQPALVNARFIKPLCDRFYRSLFTRFDHVVTVESNSTTGGFGSGIMELATALGFSGRIRFLQIGYPDNFIPHGSNSELLKSLQLDPDSISRRIREFLTT